MDWTNEELSADEAAIRAAVPGVRFTRTDYDLSLEAWLPDRSKSVIVAQAPRPHQDGLRTPAREAIAFLLG